MKNRIIAALLLTFLSMGVWNSADASPWRHRHHHHHERHNHHERHEHRM